MIASLPMYDWPQIRTQTDTFWSRFANQLRAAGIEAPAKLQRDDTHLHWHSKNLFLSQTCIYPLVTQLPPTTVVLGTPIYDVPCCKEGHYASVILVRGTDKPASLAAMRGTTLAYNATHSQSGFNALRNLLVSATLVTQAKPYFFSKALCTGSHRNSAISVVDGSADLCALDPVSWALLQEHDKPIASKLIALSETDYSPALPLICHSDTIPQGYDEQQWRELIQAAFNTALQQNDLPGMRLSGIANIPKSDYFKLVIHELDIFNYSTNW